MKWVTIPALAAMTALSPSFAAQAADTEVPIVSAENVYGDIARQIGGDRVDVTSILSNPDQDPHLFETTPSVARALAYARIVIVNGADYDHWMLPLLAAQPAPQRVVIVVADLIGMKPGDNPHLWYNRATPPAIADALTKALTAADPDGAPDYLAGRNAFLAGWARVEQRIAAIQTKNAGAPITASEPVFGYMAEALGLTMRNERFQMSVMNDTEPSARDIAAMEDDLRARKVRAFVYNQQVADPLTDRLLGIARKAGVPVVGVTETLPADTKFQDWILHQLNALADALGDGSS